MAKRLGSRRSLAACVMTKQLWVWLHGKKEVIDFFLGGLSPTIQGERLVASGKIMFSPYYEPSRDGLTNQDMSGIQLFLDSGAFQRQRNGSIIEHQQCLELQMHRERQLATEAYAIASNDLLAFDENSEAVERTIAAAKYLASQRQYLGDRICVMGCQGFTQAQYVSCASSILEHVTDRDWLALGGWCNLGKKQQRMQQFRRTMLEVIPLIADSPVCHVHIYGVLFQPALGNLLWLCDQHGLTLSTDSQKPLSDCRYKSPASQKKAGARRPYWKDNVEWWRSRLQNFRDTVFYRDPRCGSVPLKTANKGKTQLCLPIFY